MTKKSEKSIKVVTLFVNFFIQTLIGFATWIFILIPLIFPLYAFLSFFRHLVHRLAKTYRPDLIPIVNVADASMVFIPSDKFPSMNVAQVWKIKGRLNVEKFRDHFYTTFLSTDELKKAYQNFYCYFEEWGFYCFKKPVKKLNLESHIREINLEDGVTIEEFVVKWMANGSYGALNDINNIYKENSIICPCWEMLVINKQVDESNDVEGNVDIDESFLLFKIHHGLADGYTFIHLVEKLTGVKSPYGFKEEKLSLFQKIKLWLNLPNIWIEYHVKQATSKDLLYPLRHKNPEWFISFVTLDLQEIKSIRQNFKTHFNCVIISAVVGSLRRHFVESGRVTDNISELPEITWVGGSIGLPDHPAMVTDSGTMTNHMTIGGFRVPLREKSPSKRLMALEQDFDLFHKRGVHKLVHWALFKSIWALPAPMNRFANKYDNFGFLRYTTYVSPLMLSSEAFELMGHKVQSLYLPALTPSLCKYTSMYVIPVSVSGKMDLSITASSEVVNNQEDLDRFSNVLLKEALQELANL